MIKISAITLLLCAALAACASQPQPRIIQSSATNQDIVITVGMATQIEMPNQARVQSLTVGNPALVSADQAGDVVNLSGKGDAGDTNVIIRARDEDGKTEVCQYHITVQKP